MMTYASFFLNRTFIAINLCVNRNVSDSTCKGKCFLKKSIQENKEREQQCPNSQKEERVNVVFLITTDIITSPKDDSKNYSPPFGYDCFYSFQYQSDIFHPPQLS
jgi:hypothetical protein